MGKTSLSRPSAAEASANWIDPDERPFRQQLSEINPGIKTVHIQLMTILFPAKPFYQRQRSHKSGIDPLLLATEQAVGRLNRPAGWNADL
jgi:hypothetical protein